MEAGAIQSVEKRGDGGRWIIPPVSPGRPKGARSKLAGAFIEAMHDDFIAHGTAVIAQVREEKPDQYLKVIAAILPKEIEAGEETLNAIAELMNRVDGRTRTVGVPQIAETVQ